DPYSYNVIYYLGFFLFVFSLLAFLVLSMTRVLSAPAEPGIKYILTALAECCRKRIRRPPFRTQAEAGRHPLRPDRSEPGPRGAGLHRLKEAELRKIFHFATAPPFACGFQYF
ncbi:MAG: hypothetical protein ILP14_11250, partial [Oscillospiraceae bacterium]|nr:hypothetical protein [Oscillospiraceae bacterium]